MRMWIEGPRVGPLHFGVVFPESAPVPLRPAPRARWGLRFVAVFVALLPIWMLGLLQEGGEIGPSPMGLLWLLLVVVAAAIRAGVRLARYPAPMATDTLRWAGTALGAGVAGLLLSALLAAVLAA